MFTLRGSENDGNLDHPLDLAGCPHDVLSWREFVVWDAVEHPVEHDSEFDSCEMRPEASVNVRAKC